MHRWLPAVACLVVGVALALWAGRLPLPRGADSDPTQFAADRAMVDIEAIARKPHPIGSTEIDEVRAYLLSRLQGLGLKSELRPGIGISTDARAPAFAVAGTVQNIVGEVTGSDPSLPAVLIMAHYDTVPNSPGAADDTAGVAVALEIARSLIASGPHKRSVLLLLTDGEEPGLLGAAAFFADDPLRRRVGLVLNLEARGNGGRTAMFETSPNNGELIDLYSRHVAHPSGDSLSVSLYRLMPNNSDFTPALRHGMTGMNFAFAGDQVAYHTQLATPGKLDRGSVQHMGDQVLSIVRELVDSPTLPQARPDTVYSDVLGSAVISYSAAFGWIIVALAISMFAFAAVQLRRRKIVSWRCVVGGVQTFVLLLAGNLLLLQLCSRLLQWLTGSQTSEHVLLGNFGVLQAGCVLVSLATSAFVVATLARGARLGFMAGAIVIGLICNLGGLDVVAIAAMLLVLLLGYFNRGREPNPTGLWLGVVGCALVLTLILQAMFPAGAYLIGWPVLLATVGALIVTLSGLDLLDRAALLIFGVLGAIMFGHLGSQAAGFFTAVGPVFPPVIAPFAVLAMLVPLPLIYQAVVAPRSELVALGIGLVGLVLVLIAASRPSTPTVTEVFYVADVEADRSYRVSLLPTLDDWARTTLSAGGAEPEHMAWQPVFTEFGEKVWRSAAPAAGLQRVEMNVTKVAAAAGERLELQVRPGNSGRSLRVWINPSVDLTNAHIEDRPVPLQASKGAWAEVRYYAPSEAGFTISFDAPESGEVDVRVIETRDGWPSGLEPKQPSMNVMPWRHSGSTMVADRLQYSW